MIKISRIIPFALAVVFLTTPSYADLMNEQAAMNATIRPSVTPSGDPCTAVRIYFTNGNWLALDVVGEAQKILKGGKGDIVFEEDATINGTASYCLRPPEVEGKEVGADCAPIKATLSVAPTDAGFPHVKGVLSWDALEFTVAPHITFEAEYQE